MSLSNNAPEDDSVDLNLHWMTRRGRKRFSLYPSLSSFFSSNLTLPGRLLGVDKERNATPPLHARFFTLLPQLSWQRIPLAPGSHRPHKLIRHLLESSADSEAGSFKANIFVRHGGSSITFEGWEELEVKCCHCSDGGYARSVFSLLTIYSQDVWPHSAPFHLRGTEGLWPTSPFSRAQDLTLMGSGLQRVLCLASKIVG